jgi:2-hydroxychromene-2-carboxylate isomerase
MSEGLSNGGLQALAEETKRSELEFWYDFASPYSYLAASRIERITTGRPIRLVWKPLLLGPIFKRRPQNASLFQEVGPEEAKYRRRDVERHCELYGLALQWPSTYPRSSLLATRLALIAADEGWCGEFSRAIFHASFADDHDIAAEQVVADVVQSLGRRAGDYIQRAGAPETKARLIAEVDHAIHKGVFGAPTFIIGDEIFWGNDRLEQAWNWLDRDAADRRGHAA